MQVAGLGLASLGGRENLLKPREEASQVFGSFRRPGREPSWKGCASGPLLCCGRGVGERMSPVQSACSPIRESAQLYLK